MHQQYQGVSKSAKKTNRKKQTKKGDTPGGATKEKESTPKATRRPSAAQTARQIAKAKDAEEMDGQQDCLAKEAPAGCGSPEPSLVKQEKRPTAQEIITSSGKKILIQSTFAGIFVDRL